MAEIEKIPMIDRAVDQWRRRKWLLIVCFLSVFTVAVCLIAAWHPANVRYFSIFFACTGFMTAYLLPPWRFTTTGKTSSGNRSNP